MKLGLCIKDELSNKVIAKTPSGSNCLWICSDDEKAEFAHVDSE
jgi:hypothetical protein